MQYAYVNFGFYVNKHDKYIISNNSTFIVHSEN